MNASKLAMAALLSAPNAETLQRTHHNMQTMYHPVTDMLGRSTNAKRFELSAAQSHWTDATLEAVQGGSLQTLPT